MIKVETIQNRLRDMEHELARDHGFRICNNIPLMDNAAVTGRQPPNAGEAIKPEEHHKMATNQKDPLYLNFWLAEHAEDPATKVRTSMLTANSTNRCALPSAFSTTP